MPRNATRKNVVFVWYITNPWWWKLIKNHWIYWIAEGELLETTTFWKSLWTVQSIVIQGSFLKGRKVLSTLFKLVFYYSIFLDGLFSKLPKRQAACRCHFRRRRRIWAAEISWVSHPDWGHRDKKARLQVGNTLWWTNIAMENGPFIVDFPIKNGGSFHCYVSSPEGKKARLQVGNIAPRKDGRCAVML